MREQKAKELQQLTDHQRKANARQKEIVAFMEKKIAEEI